MWEETGKTQMNASEEELEESAAHVQIKHMDLFWIFKQRLSKEESWLPSYCPFQSEQRK